MTGSDISSNSVVDLANEEAVYSTNVLFDAQNNWWGDPDGPDGGGVSGPGQVVGGNVDATSYLTSPSTTRVVHVWYNRLQAAMHAILTSRNNFTGTVFQVGDGDTPVNNSPSDVGGPFSYPSGILDHKGIKTGSAMFMSESMYAGGFPMSYGIDLSNNVEYGDCNQDSGSAISGWRVCVGDNLGASQTWKSHPILSQYLTSYSKGFIVNPSTPPDPEGMSFDTVEAYINFGSNGTVTDDQLYELFDNEYAEVQTGDYIVINQDNGVYHGFLIVGWGPVQDCLVSLNARLDTETGPDRQEFTLTRQPNTIPYVADFCYGYYDADNTSLQYEKSGWLQDPRPRPFYCSALRVEDDNAFDPDVVGMTILGTGNYWERIRTAFHPFIFDDISTAFPNWVFIHVPDSVDVRYDRFLSP